jgi:hypothetical protein
MEFLVLTPRNVKNHERERIILEAVIEAAEAAGIERIIKRRGNVYSIGVYLNDGRGKILLYNDWDKDWGWRRIFDVIMSTMNLSKINNPKSQLILTPS